MTICKLLARRAGIAGAACFAIPLAACTTLDVPAEMPRTQASREDIFVLRSQRAERVSNSTWCTPERAGGRPFPNGLYLEDRFTMHSVSVRPEDGRVVSTDSGKVGELHTCLGPGATPGSFNFHVEGMVAGVAVSGTGPCTGWRADYPEKGFSIGVCMVTIGDLPAPYVGGLLTTSSLNTKALLGGETEPAGYTQASIATMRLWK